MVVVVQRWVIQRERVCLSCWSQCMCVADSVFVWFSSTVVLAVTIYSTTSLVGIVNIDMTNLTIGYVGFTLIAYLVTLYIWFVFP